MVGQNWWRKTGRVILVAQKWRGKSGGAEKVAQNWWANTVVIKLVEKLMPWKNWIKSTKKVGQNLSDF